MNDAHDSTALVGSVAQCRCVDCWRSDCRTDYRPTRHGPEAVRLWSYPDLTRRYHLAAELLSKLLSQPKFSVALNPRPIANLPVRQSTNIKAR